MNNMKIAHIVKLTDNDGDLQFKLVDQDTWNWIIMENSGIPEPTKRIIFSNFFTGKIVSRWEDKLCPDSIRERIKTKYLENYDSFDGVFITYGSWDNDRALLAPPLEDNYDLFCRDYSRTIDIINMIENAKAKGYNVEFEHEYVGLMY